MRGGRKRGRREKEKVEMINDKRKESIRRKYKEKGRNGEKAEKK